MAMNVDQNFSVYFDGVNGSTVKKKKNRGGLGGSRKALTDISNSGKPPALNTRSRKQNPKNVMIPIGEDLGVFKKKNEEKNSINVAEEGLLHNSCVKSQEELWDLDFDVAEQGFLHNHDECVKLQKEELDSDFDKFLKTLHEHEDEDEDDYCESKDENVSMFDEMEEIPEMLAVTELLSEDEVDYFLDRRFLERSPSPISATISDLFDSFELRWPCLTPCLIESPRGSP